MRIYIQSKSGDFNVESTELGKFANNDLKCVLAYLRSLGGYHTTYRGHKTFVPLNKFNLFKASE